jgi:hypothetical protein
MLFFCEGMIYSELFFYTNGLHRFIIDHSMYFERKKTHCVIKMCIWSINFAFIRFIQFHLLDLCRQKKYLNL